MDIDVALTELGVRPPTDELRIALDEHGFAVVPGVLDPEALAQVRGAVDRLTAEEGDRAGSEFAQEAGASRLSDLVNKGPEFDVFHTHPLVLGGIAHVLGGDLQLSSLNSRAALPGEGHQGLHVDWNAADGTPERLGGYQVCNSIWLLDDFTAANGATRAVPGTHRGTLTPGEAMTDPADAHPDQVLLLAPAGTCVIFNSHLWHGGTRNTTDRPRRAVHSYFTRRSRPQQVDQRAHLRPETRERLSDASLTVLGV